MQLTERFWSKVRKGDGCWEWTGCKDKNGYGTFWAGEKRRAARTHRIAYEVVKGPIPSGLHVLHRCDNPPCVNPAHLYVGTNLQNMADRRERGRDFAQFGVKHHAAKLCPDAVRAARERFKAGATLVSLARESGVHYMVMFKAVHRITWKHVA